MPPPSELNSLYAPSFQNRIPDVLPKFHQDRRPLCTTNQSLVSFCFFFFYFSSMPTSANQPTSRVQLRSPTARRLRLLLLLLFLSPFGRVCLCVYVCVPTRIVCTLVVKSTPGRTAVGRSLGVSSDTLFVDLNCSCAAVPPSNHPASQPAAAAPA